MFHFLKLNKDLFFKTLESLKKKQGFYLLQTFQNKKKTRIFFANFKKLKNIDLVFWKL